MLARFGAVGQQIHDLMARGFGVLALQAFTVVIAFIQIIGIYKSSFVCADGWDTYNQMVPLGNAHHTHSLLDQAAPPPHPQLLRANKASPALLHCANQPGNCLGALRSSILLRRCMQ